MSKSTFSSAFCKLVVEGKTSGVGKEEMIDLLEQEFVVVEAQKPQSNHKTKVDNSSNVLLNNDVCKDKTTTIVPRDNNIVESLKDILADDFEEDDNTGLIMDE